MLRPHISPSLVRGKLGPLAARIVMAAVWSAVGAGTLAAGSAPVAVVNGVPLEQWEVDRQLALQISAGTYHRSVPKDRMKALACQSLEQLVLKELKWQWAQENRVQVDSGVVEASWQEVRDRFKSDEEYRAALETKGVPAASFRRAFHRDAAAAAVDAAIVTGVQRPTAIEVEVYYILHNDEYVSPEARHVVHVLVYVPPTASREERQRAERHAHDLVREVSSGGPSLLEVAKPLIERVPPQLRDQVGDMGYVHRGSLLPAVDEAVFGADPGSVTGPVATIYGYHVLRVVAARPPRPLELANVREAVATRLLVEKRKRRLEEFESGLRRDAVIEVNGCAGSF